MAKSNAQRFDDSLNSLKEVDKSLATHVEKVMKDANVTKDTIGGELSLGTRFDVFDRDETTKKRHLIRALLLCQRVYFSRIWSRVNLVGGAQQAADCYPGGGTWQATREASCTFWEKKGEPEIKEGIRMFAPTTSASYDTLVNAAKAPGDGRQLPDVTLTRSLSPFPGHPTCYSSVMYWLVRSGITSYRWLLRHSLGAVAGKAQFEEIFGKGTDIWRSTPQKVFTDADTLKDVPKGHIVHLYVDIPARYAGHWLVSAGGGKAYGRNNDDEKDMPGGPVDRAYALCNLKNQFLAYNDENQQTHKPWEGVATVIDPMKIPNRL